MTAETWPNTLSTIRTLRMAMEHAGAPKAWVAQARLIECDAVRAEAPANVCMKETDPPEPGAFIPGYRVTFGELERACSILKCHGWSGFVRFDEAVAALVKPTSAAECFGEGNIYKDSNGRA